MSATNGSTVLRSRGRIIGIALVAILALGAMFASAASAKVKPIKETTLAMGDSLAFGYSQQLFNENEKLGLPDTAFEHGYANEYVRIKHGAANGNQLVNVGCPGETTDSMIGTGPLGKAIDPTGTLPCLYHLGLGAPLHHEYGGAKSQLESALEVLGTEAALGTPVTTITLNIGANDELAQIHACEKEVTEEFVKTGKSVYGATPTEAVKNCILSHVPALFTHILTNIGAILTVLREWQTKFGGPFNYTGKIVVQGSYDPYGNVFGTGELLPESNALAGALNLEESKVVALFGACYANPQSQFNPGGKAEQKKLQTWTNMANATEFEGKKNGPDIHPTPLGYLQLAKIMKAACG
jgi:lysophospholipase L1-like esterase